MKGEEDDDASWFNWLSKEMWVFQDFFMWPIAKANSKICFRLPGSKIGADPSLTGALTWLEWEKFFKKNGQNLTLTPIYQNPIDLVWYDRPSRPNDELEVHEVKYSGMYFQKISK